VTDPNDTPRSAIPRCSIYHRQQSRRSSFGSDRGSLTFVLVPPLQIGVRELRPRRNWSLSEKLRVPLLGTAVFPPLVSPLNIAGCNESDILVALRRRILDMKQFLAACVAIAVLWAIDVQYNEGRYSAVVKRAFNSIVAR
jgi:hypothetical protein